MTYLRALAQLPLFYTLAGFRLSRRGRRRQLKSGQILIFLHRWRRRIRHHRLHRHHGQQAPPTSRCQACCSAGRLQIPGENLHALRRPSRWFGSLDDQKAVGRRRPVGLMVGRVRGSTPRGGTAGGPLGSSVVGSASCSCRGLLVCVGEQPTARRAPRIAPACFPRVPPAPPSSPPAPPPLPLTSPRFWQFFCLLTVDFLLLFMVAQGASPAPVPVPPTLALPSR